MPFFKLDIEFGRLSYLLIKFWKFYFNIYWAEWAEGLSTATLYRGCGVGWGWDLKEGEMLKGFNLITEELSYFEILQERRCNA